MKVGLRSRPKTQCSYEFKTLGQTGWNTDCDRATRIAPLIRAAQPGSGERMRRYQVYITTYRC